MPPDHRQAQAIAHVFVNYLSVRDAEDPFARAVLAEMVLAKIFDFDGIVIDGKDVDATPLIAGATLAMQALLKAYEDTGITHDDAIIAWRDRIESNG